MSPDRERHLIAGVASGDVEAIGVGEVRRITICRADHAECRVTFAQIDTGRCQRSRGEAQTALHRWLPSQRLLQSLAPSIRTRTGCLQLFGVQQ
jgi:hypothetical protein